MATSTGPERILLLSGGVGGAKLALGFSRRLEPAQLAIVVNTGDDFRHLGLAISPDLDTVLYTLAGVVNGETGWGRAEETWSFMEALGELGGETWFRLGDRDLALHVERTQRLAAGAGLRAVTAALCRQLGVAVTLLPMTEASVRTIVSTMSGDLPFQDYFVKHRAEPVVTGLRYEGAATAPPDASIASLCTDPALAAIVIAPSNPWLSIGPMLAIPSLRAAVRASRAPVVAVSPLVAGRALKGPTAKLMAELGLAAGNTGIAAHYAGLIDALVIDHADAADVPALEALGLTVHVTGTVMNTLADRERLAGDVLELVGRLSAAPRTRR